ncbi:NAD(P)-binding protein [Paraburkholderia sp. HP33-1]|uniref:NAD(P)-binding protein n=1 Tax=Paraburkholderia sp. HP33-1 TaxID=2883243 RepID=UPI001F438B22|nr:NAD(P)-binding protein [Paraburkholderia sp. HP33-1]
MSTNPTYKSAVVIGAGIGGLAAAQALADHFDQVIVLERDHLPSDTRPRRGVPQGKHPHGLLSGGLGALCDLFPNFTASLADAGAHAGDAGLHLRVEMPEQEALPRRYLDVPFFTMTRPLLERVVRQRVEERKNVVFRGGCRVVGIVGEPDGRSVCSVSFITAEGKLEEAPANVVVDASGRGIPTLDFLNSTGHPMPEETIIGVGLSYATAVLEIADDSKLLFKALVTSPKAPARCCRGVMVLREDGYWLVTLVQRGVDRLPANREEFLALASSLDRPTLYNAIKDSTLHGKITQFAFPESWRRHFDRIEDFPRGLIPIGDSVCRFNPVHAQGMSAALQEAVVLRNLLAARATQQVPFATLGQEYLSAIQPIIENPWTLSAFPDLAHPDAEGERPTDLEEVLEYQSAVGRVAFHDSDVHKLLYEVLHLIKPVSALHSQEVMDKVRGNQSPMLEITA